MYEKSLDFRFRSILDFDLPPGQLLKECCEALPILFRRKGGLKIEEEIIKPLSKKYPIEVQSFSVDQLKNYDLLIKFEKELKVKENELPAVIIGEKILGGEAEIRRDLEGSGQVLCPERWNELAHVKRKSVRRRAGFRGLRQKRIRNQERSSMEPFSICQVASTVKR